MKLVLKILGINLALVIFIHLVMAIVILQQGGLPIDPEILTNIHWQQYLLQVGIMYILLNALSFAVYFIFKWDLDEQ